MKTIRKGSTVAVLSRLLIAAVVFMLAVVGFGGGTAQAAGVVSNCTWGGAVAAWMAHKQPRTLAETAQGSSSKGPAVIPKGQSDGGRRVWAQSGIGQMKTGTAQTALAT